LGLAWHPGVVRAWLVALEALYAVFASVGVWALLALLDKDRQFLHDRLAGTRLVQLPKPEKKTAAQPAA